MNRYVCTLFFPNFPLCKSIGGILKELHCEPEDSYNYKQYYLNINSLVYGHDIS